MTKLEEHLYNEVKNMPDDYLNHIKNHKSEVLRTIFPCIIDGITDMIEKDNTTGKYILIYEYYINLDYETKTKRLDVTQIFEEL